VNIGNQLCPIHRSRFCCGREDRKKRGERHAFSNGVKRIPDASNPRGHREIRTPAEMRRLLVKKLQEQNGMCGICSDPITDIREVVADHIEPRGNGGGRRDDHPSNIQAAHGLCNTKKGSRRLG
jgi:5-methylcytosine-specific restriction endonuclease McrA